jgi:hypothetical protein
MTQPSRDADFDLRARAELALAYDPGEPPAGLFRKTTPWFARRNVLKALAGLALAGGGAGTVFAMRPPDLVRGAIEHEYYERTLRGSFMDPESLLRHLGMTQVRSVPGYPQLMRICDIDGRVVYHLTTFFEHGGMVTVFAFDEPVTLREAEGWWANVYWQVVKSREGRPLVMVAEKKGALAVARAKFA